MKVDKIMHGAVVIFNVDGPMVEEELEALDDLASQCINAGQLKVILDLQGTPFVDSAGLEKIQNMLSDFGKRGGDLKVAGLNEVCQDIFAATRMDGFVQVFDDREAALRSLL